jgi:hypothetical protein
MIILHQKWRMFGSNNYIEHPKDIRISLTKRKDLNDSNVSFDFINIYFKQKT